MVPSSSNGMHAWAFAAFGFILAIVGWGMYLKAHSDIQMSRDQLRKIEKQVDELRDRERTLNNQIRDLETDRDRVSGHLEQANRSLSEAQLQSSEVFALRQEMGQAKRLQAEQTQAIERLNQENQSLRQARQQHESLANQCQTTLNEQAQSTQATPAVAARCADLELELKQATTERSQAEAHVQALRSQLEALEKNQIQPPSAPVEDARIGQQAERIAALEQELRQAQTRLVQAEELVQTARSAQQVLQESLTKQQVELDRQPVLQAEMSRLHESLSECQNRVTELPVTIPCQAPPEETVQAGGDCTALQDAAQAEQARLRAELQSCADQHAALNQSLEQIRIDHRAQEQQWHQAQSSQAAAAQSAAGGQSQEQGRQLGMTETSRAREQEAFKALEADLKVDMASHALSIERPASGPAVLSLSNQAIFGSGDAHISKAGQKLLNRIAKLLNQFPERRIIVMGHTDDLPVTNTLKDCYPSNWELSAFRGALALRYLQWGAGVDPKRMQLVGAAQYQPRVAVKSNQARAGNRRIEIQLLPPETAIKAGTQAAGAQ